MQPILPRPAQSIVSSSSQPGGSIPPWKSPMMKTASFILQAVQLLAVNGAVNGALVLLPGALVPGGLDSRRLWLIFIGYSLFFCLGTLFASHGPLTPRALDKQVKDIKSKLALVLFVISMPILHWLLILFYLRSRAPTSPIFRYYTGSVFDPSFLPSSFYIWLDLFGSIFILTAIVLNCTAANKLGSAYDRLVAPVSLVTTGPYALIRHPIYTSYLLLFVGFALSLHSVPFASLLAMACILYYRQRIYIEEGILQAAFGNDYDLYKEKTRF